MGDPMLDSAGEVFKIVYIEMGDFILVFHIVFLSPRKVENRPEIAVFLKVISRYFKWWGPQHTTQKSRAPV